MQAVKIKLILCLIIASVILIYVPLDVLMNWRISAANKETGLYYSDYGGDLAVTFCFCLIGTIWTCFTAVGIITIFLSYEKTFIWGGIYWIVVTIITAVYIVLIMSWSTSLVHSYKDLTTAERIEVENFNYCCFYTGREDIIKGNGEEYRDYYIYSNCPLIDITNPDIDFDHCENGDDGDLVCLSYFVGISGPHLICDSGSDYFVFSMFAVIMVTYCCFTLTFGVLYFIYYRLVGTKENIQRYEDINFTGNHIY